MALDNQAIFALVLIYIIGFMIAAFFILKSSRDKKDAMPWWVPAFTRRDACAMPFCPIFFLLPFIFWPLVVPFLFLRTAKSICGIPLSRKKQTGTDGGDSETTPDLELGVVACGGRGVSDGGEEGGSGGARVRSADSPGLEIPPPYTSAASGQDGDVGTEGPLGKSVN